MWKIIFFSLKLFSFLQFSHFILKDSCTTNKSKANVRKRINMMLVVYNDLNIPYNPVLFMSFNMSNCKKVKHILILRLCLIIIQSWQCLEGQAFF